MKMIVNYKSTATCVLLLICLCALVASATDQPQNEPPPPSSSTSARDRFKMPKLFDFARFKELYKKSYKSIVETVVREKLFLARAFRAFISGIRYKHGEKPYYLKVNKLSDWTPEEVDATRSYNDGLTDAGTPLEQLNQQTTTTTPMPLPLLDREDIVEELTELQRHADEPQFEEIVQELQLSSNGQTEAQRHRDVAAKGKFSIDDLVAGAERAVESPEVAAKLQRIVPSNNPEHEPPELMSFGANSHDYEAGEFQITDPSYFSQAVGSRKGGKTVHHTGVRRVAHKIHDLVHRNRNSVKVSDSASKDYTPRQPDEVFVDHRESGCFMQPRDQGQCGSCYAFAYVSILEYLYCKATGKLTQFSEQYMVDCGHRQHPSNEGCKGAARLLIGRFVINYGIELGATYPYVKRRNQCPYPRSTDKSQMGYLKPNMQMYYVPNRIPQMEAMVAVTPIVLGIGTHGSDFQEYGGGVHDMNGCRTHTSDHAVLLVGHGREDDREYWLIRNSFGPSFGEDGYYKLEKRVRCTFFDGLAFGQGEEQPNGKFVPQMQPEENGMNNHEIVTAFGKRISAPVYKRMWYKLTNS